MDPLTRRCLRPIKSKNRKAKSKASRAKAQSRKESQIFNAGLNPNQSLAFLCVFATLREKMFLVDLATLKLGIRMPRVAMIAGEFFRQG
jgi:hypothetical protein